MNNDRKFAVVCINNYFRSVSSIDVFDKYEDARVFMNRDVNEVAEETKKDNLDYNLRIANHGSSVTLWDGHRPWYNWSIKSVNIH